MRKRSGRTKRLLLVIFASFALGLTSITGVLGAFGGEKDVQQAPRGMQVPHEREPQAPRGQDTQAPRDEGTQAPRVSGDTVRGA